MKKVKPSLVLSDEDLKKITTYPPELQTELFHTSLAVQSPYLLAKINGEQYIVASWIAEYKKAGKAMEDIEWNEVITRHINPFKEENLLDDVAKLNVREIESLLEFCNKYGLMGEKINNISIEKSGVDTLGRRILANAKESLSYFVKETLIIQGLITTYHDIIQPLNDYYKDTNDTSIEKTIDEMELKLKQGINSKLGLVRPAINLEAKGKYLPGYTTSTLLGAIYYQFYEVVTSGKQFKECVNCGSLFIPRKSNAKFCPPFTSGEHSSCQNSYNQMKSRAKKSVRTGKKTIEEVANSLGRPLAEVRGWFD
ncbi:hypothetical protein ABEP42_26610 [Priestia megaterium]|uniref:hypothetical protein n=1 Tax=Priestia megaterium TaxID=1404 RepID=UPI00317B9933